MFLLFGLGGRGGGAVFFAVWAGGWTCCFFCCLGGGHVFFCCWGAGHVFHLPFGALSLFVFFSVCPGDGNSLTYRSAWLFLQAPNNKKQKHGFIAFPPFTNKMPRTIRLAASVVMT